MANYETMFLLSLKNGEEATAAMVERIKNLISANGTLDSVDEWGKRKLAYEINKLSEGDYTLVDFHADPDHIAELDRVLRINDNVQRHMIVRRNDRD